LVLILVLKFSKIAAVLPNTGLSLQGHCQTYSRLLKKMLSLRHMSNK